MAELQPRESWGTKLGVIMAVAGSAVGLGNFLRFPGQAAQNGGGAFMIPYFICILLLGIPLMWVEWTIGRYGGGFGHGTAPGIFHTLWRKNRFIKYFGIIGILGPILIYIYYIYIESWVLGFTIFSATGAVMDAADTPETMRAFLNGYRGLESNQYFQNLGWAYAFLVITHALNVGVLYHGIRGGIEKLSKIAMPLLFVLGIILAIRSLSFGTPDPANPDWNVSNGLGFLWNPDFSALSSAKTWLAAAGQVFFTLSVGIGVILTYASYLKRGDDVALSGLTAVSTNELCEVILGGSIIIPAAVAFFGLNNVQGIASKTFDLSFITMPMIFNHLHFGQLFATLWFALLTLAAITSSISIAQPAIAFMEDELDVDRKTAVLIFGTGTFILAHLSVFFLKNGVLDDLDFWAGNFFLVVFALIEVVLFGWVFGIDRAWKEIHHGAELKIPEIYKFIIKFITPFVLLTILGFWFYQEWWDIIFMKKVPEADRPVVLASRLMILTLAWGMAVMVKLAWRRKKKIEEGWESPERQ
jgi:SNF family Na+-dependent transporter